MEIGSVIRTYRKQKGMTQEEMANRLGVTTPAVNKWENGVSMPDIQLLAPIARLLGVSLEELLSFREALSAEEIRGIIEELDAKLETQPYAEVFAWAQRLVQEYPNCNQLIWQLAVVLDARRITQDVEHKEQYDEPIMRYFQIALKDGDAQVRKQAAGALFGLYIRKEEYDRAQECLAYFSQDDPERTLKQAQIYKQKGMEEEAYRAYEQLVFTSYQILNQALSMLYMLSMEKGDYDRAKRYLDKQSELARVLEMGRYNELSGYLDFAAGRKDVAETVRIMKELLANIHTLGGFTKSFLYEHLHYKPVDGAFCERVKKELVGCMKDREGFAYMEGCDEWERMIQEAETTV